MGIRKRYAVSSHRKMELLYVLFVFVNLLSFGITLNLDYLDPVKLQTKSSPKKQQETAFGIIRLYLSNFQVEIDPIMFNDHKDVFSLRTVNGELHIRASTGVAAVWGFNYYLKKYCKSQIAWQVKRVVIPQPLPEVDEVVVANDRFRYYQNVCTASYSFVWWKADVEWYNHVVWMALNGINIALAPVAQEAAWTKIYKQLGMSEDDINDHFTGPGFLAWLRMGNVHGWGGPLMRSWHERQKQVQDKVLDMMFSLGMVPVFPAFNGHVPRAFKDIFPNMSFYEVGTWNKFNSDYCCNLFIDPKEPEFKTIGKMFLREITAGTGTGNIYTADPFNEVEVQPWSTSLAEETAKSIFSTMSEIDKDAVWLLQNWMFVHNPVLWPLKRVQTFLTSVPNGRMLILDLQSEQWPQYDLYEMYYGQPFIWCMLHNFGGTLGMFGNMQTINEDVYKVRDRVNSTMIGIGLTPEGINQNYVVYDLMLEAAWRSGPVKNLSNWVSEYAERRYGCSETATAWKYLLKSVYNFSGLNRIRGKYVITRRPSFRIRPWAWYRSHDLFEAFKGFISVNSNYCVSPGFLHDLVDVTRQVLQYRTEQIYVNLLRDQSSNTLIFNFTINRFLDAMNDMESILATNNDFRAITWLNSAREVAFTSSEAYLYELNARNQITLWGPKGEITDYACKQWAELFRYYYTPRWARFLQMALDAKIKNEIFDERGAQAVVRYSVEEKFLVVDIADINITPWIESRGLAVKLYQKWAFASDLEDLPFNVIKKNSGRRTTLADTDIDGDDVENSPSVVMLHSTTPTN